MPLDLAPESERRLPLDQRFHAYGPDMAAVVAGQRSNNDRSNVKHEPSAVDT